MQSEQIESHIAQCYIYRDGDEKYKCELTNQRLVVKKNKLIRDFPLETIKKLTVQQRKLLVPIIFSGIFTPLIVVGFFQDFFHPVIALIFIITGIFAFYIGWLGLPAITIQHMGGHTDFMVEYVTRNMLAFIEFTNQYINTEPPENRALYALIEKKNDESSEVLMANVLNSKPDLFSYKQLKEVILSDPGSTDYLILAIDPFKTGSEIKYEMSKNDHTLRPISKGHINRDAVLGYFTSEEFLNLSFE